MSSATYLLLGSLLGGLLGLLAGWMLGRRGFSPDARLENELRHQLDQRSSEVAQLRTELTEATRGKSAAEASREAAEKLLTQQKEIQEKALRDAKEAQESALQDLRNSFKALS